MISPEQYHINNQKTTNELADFGRLTNLPTCELVKLDYIVANQEILSSPVYVNNFRAVEIGGVEPPKRGLTSPQGKPAIPTALVLYQNNSQKSTWIISLKP